MNKIHIRKALPADALLIAGISRDTFYHTYAKHNTKENMDQFLAEQFSREILMAQVNDEANIFLLAYMGDEPAGYVFLKDSEQELLPGKNVIEISRIYACTSFIGKGVGKALIQASIQHAKAMHKETIWLGVWEHNQRAIEFYTKCGFKKFGEQTFILGKDIQQDWLMQLSITNY